MMSPLLVHRSCNACRGKMLRPTCPKHRQHNCMTIGSVRERPTECWLNSAHSDAKDLLVGLGSYQGPLNAAPWRRPIVDTLYAHPHPGPGRDAAVRATLQRIDVHSVHFFLSRLPEDSSLRRYLQSLLPGARDRRAERPKHRLPRWSVELPPEFARSVLAFEEHTDRLVRVRRARGHRYQDASAVARKTTARRICEYFASIGHGRWLQVAQRDYDAYTITVGPAEARHAGVFLRFVMAHYRVTTRFVRPRYRRRPALSSAVDHRSLPDLGRKAAQLADPRLRLMGLLLIFYAQPLRRTALMRTCDFRIRNGKTEALFGTEWMPLDAQTARVIGELHPSLGAAVSEPIRLMNAHPSTLQSAFKRALHLDVKAVRLGAIAAILASGVAHRGVLAALLGVSTNTIEFVERTMPWDLQKTVPFDVVQERNRVVRGEALA